MEGGKDGIGRTTGCFATVSLLSAESCRIDLIRRDSNQIVDLKLLLK